MAGEMELYFAVRLRERFRSPRKLYLYYRTFFASVPNMLYIPTLYREKITRSKILRTFSFVIYQYFYLCVVLRDVLQMVSLVEVLVL